MQIQMRFTRLKIKKIYISKRVCYLCETCWVAGKISVGSLNFVFQLMHNIQKDHLSSITYTTCTLSDVRYLVCVCHLENICAQRKQLLTGAGVSGQVDHPALEGECSSKKPMSRCWSHQYHVTCGDVHVGVGGLLAPGRDTAPGWGADGCTGIAELRWHAVDPGGDGLWTLAGWFDGHTLPAQLLQGRVDASNPLLALALC